MVINFSKIEKKWQKKWAEEGAFKSKDSGKNKFYVLEMFPYPSGSGLHMGHAFNYTVGDIYARFKRMSGFNVLYPMGYDSFGLPAENAAKKAKQHPKKFTEASIKNFIRQQKELGLSYDWDRIIMTHKPEYYKWNQYFFLKFLEKGLAYRKKAAVNWDPVEKSVLANEQVINGKGWRSGADIEIKYLDQWFIKTTNYADEVLNDIDKLDWPARIKRMQKNWIGRSEGTEIMFKINGKDWKIFTTRPDTLMGVTYMVVAAGHQDLMSLVTDKQKGAMKKFSKKIKSTKQEDLDKLDKEGVFTGSYAEHPLTGDKIPIWAGNFVIAEYGSGMVMAVPAHDQRDFEFAQKYDIPIKVVISAPEAESLSGIAMTKAYTGAGELIGSGEFDDLFSSEAKIHITNALKNKKRGKKSVQFKLRDWLISRQRYWGTPIPVVYCDDCGIVPEKEENLPILLPEKFKTGSGNPLENDKSFVNTECPNCGKKARRETDTMDTFFDSSWYYLRYTDSMNSKKPFDTKKAEYWMPVDQYIGGAEHAVMHLIYARFFSKALRDLGFVKYDEPFIRLFNQGMLHGIDGHVMSKSRGNVVLPEEVSKKYGIDTARLFLVSLAHPSKDLAWSEKGMSGSLKFVRKVVDYFGSVKIGKSSKRVESKLNKAIRAISADIEQFSYNYAVIKLRELFSSLEPEVSKKDLGSFLKLLSPFCPHIAEEFWEKIGNKGFVSLEKWPSYDVKKIDGKFEEADKLVEKVVSDVRNLVRIIEGKGKKADKIYLYGIPKDVAILDAKVLSKRIGKEIVLYSSADKKKYDPENKSKKAQPGRLGIYIE